MKVGFNAWAKFHRTPYKFGKFLGIDFSGTGGYHFDKRRDLASLTLLETRNRIKFLMSFQSSLERYSKLIYHGWINDMDFNVDIRNLSHYISIVIREAISFPEFDGSLNNKLDINFVRDNFDELYFLSDRAIDRYKKYIWKSTNNSLKRKLSKVVIYVLNLKLKEAIKNILKSVKFVVEIWRHI